MRSSRRIKKLKAPATLIRQGKWSDDEHFLMFAFVKSRREEIIEYLEANFIRREKSNKRMFFSAMAASIKTKTDKQCKSRYQKQELSFMQNIDLPQHLLQHLLTRKGKSVVSDKNSKQASRTYPTETTLLQSAPIVSMYEQDSIYTFKDLRDMLFSDIVPQLQHHSLKSTMEKFIENLPGDLSACGEPASMCHNSISMLLPAINISLINSGNRVNSFFEEWSPLI